MCLHCAVQLKIFQKSNFCHTSGIMAKIFILDVARPKSATKFLDCFSGWSNPGASRAASGLGANFLVGAYLLQSFSTKTTF